MDSGDISELPLTHSSSNNSFSPKVTRATSDQNIYSNHALTPLPVPRRTTTIQVPPSANGINGRSTTPTPSPIDKTSRRRRASSVVIMSPRKNSSTLGSLTRSVQLPVGELSYKVRDGWDKWARCWAVVNFDVDKGPDVDNLYPFVPFTKGELSNIAFSSFPDSVNGELEKGLIFNWRIPREEQNEDGETYWYGYCYFFQEKNSASNRGFVQRSIVLVSQYNFPALFCYCISLLGPSFQTHGPAMMEVATSNISRWPSPTPGTHEDVAFLSFVLTISIPSESHPAVHLTNTNSSINNSASKLLIADLPFSPFTPLFTKGLRLSFTRLLLLWELVLLSEPILVYASDPRTCANVVLHLRNLIKPLENTGDWRPYLHLHTTDFSSICTPQPRAGVIVGITNPLIFSSCKRWPHILNCTTSWTSPSTSTTMDEDEFKSGGLKSKRTRVIKKDEKIEKAWKMAVGKGDYQHADAIIAQHFQDLTLKFLSPLNRYFQTLLPSSSNRHPMTTTTTHSFRPSPFQPSTFLTQLKNSTSPLQFRTQRGVSKIGIGSGIGGFGSLGLGGLGSSSASEKGFYEAFMKTAGFGEWLRKAEEGVTRRAKGKGKGK